MKNHHNSDLNLNTSQTTHHYIHYNRPTKSIRLILYFTRFSLAQSVFISSLISSQSEQNDYVVVPNPWQAEFSSVYENYNLFISNNIKRSLLVDS